MEHIEAIIKITAICLGFGLVHSIMLSTWTKDKVQELIGLKHMQAFYRLGFVLISVSALVLAVWQIHLIPDVLIFRAPGWGQALVYTGKLGGLVLALLALREMDAKEFIGLKQLMLYLGSGKTEGDREGRKSSQIITSGIFSIVRNPIPLAGIIVITLNPVITRNWLIIILLADAYFIYGSLAKQKRLLSQFGDTYRRYMISVPLLIPRLFKAR
jgi:protein-S-isoprenylcysteine O-methyltransferase Ste14